MTTRFILSYDLQGAEDSDHTVFKTELQSRGWDACVPTKTGSKKLPETTMVGRFLDQDAANESVLRSAKAKSVKIGRFVIVAIDTNKIAGLLSDDCDP